MSGIARMSGAQPRRPKKTGSVQQTSVLATDSLHGTTTTANTQSDAGLRRSMDTLPPYQPPERNQ